MSTLRLMIGALVGVTFMGMAAAHAAPGYSTANVNMRTGPDTDYPRVTTIPEGSPIEIAGCLRDESWCDVIWAGNRGWVISEYLASDYRGGYVPLPDIGLSAVRIPIVSFVFNDYWRRHYVGRPWYSDRGRWSAYTPRPRPNWRAPPSGKRTPGWWREGYRPYAGMKAPPDRWQRPPQRDRQDGRHDRRDDRRDDRRGGDRHHDGRR